MLDRLQLLNVNYSVLRRREDNELAPGDSSDTSFNESRGNLWNLRSGTMRRYWLVRCSPAHPPFVLMKADTCFFLFSARSSAVSLKWLLFNEERYKKNQQIGILSLLTLNTSSSHISLSIVWSHSVIVRGRENKQKTCGDIEAKDKHGVILQLIPCLGQETQPVARQMWMTIHSSLSK